MYTAACKDDPSKDEVGVEGRRRAAPAQESCPSYTASPPLLAVAHSQTQTLLSSIQKAQNTYSNQSSQRPLLQSKTQPENHNNIKRLRCQHQ